MELYYLMSITDRDRAEDMAALYRDAGLNLVTTMLGRGTATPQQLALYGLSRTEKAVTGAVVGTDSMKQLFRAAKRKLFIDIPGNGLMLAVPLKSVSSGRTLAYLTDGGKSATGGVPTMNFDYELIVVILNEGHSDMVMDAARSAGAGGGTVLHAKGTGAIGTEKFFGVTLANEACDNERVTVNGRVARASYDVKVGDVITIRFGQKALSVEVLSVADNVGKADAAAMYRETTL